MKESRKNVRILALLVGMIMVNSSCVSNFLPESLDSYDKEAGYTQTLYQPKLGKTTLMKDNFNPGNSTLPFTFEISGIKRADGTEAPELTKFYPVKVWKTPYTGTETSVAEIEAKRGIEYRQLFQVRKHSGEFIMWSKANSSLVRCAPDSGYIFNVQAKNSGGYEYITQLKLIPERESDYEPNNIDLATGLDTLNYVTPLRVTGVQSASNGFQMTTNDVHIYFRHNTDISDSVRTLTFRFFNSDYTPVNPSSFNLTDWKSLVHGFDREQTNEYVRYKVAYPIPLVETVTDYTNATGDKVKVSFRYNRINSGGRRVNASIDFDFAIYTEGHWEIIFVFQNDKPLFENGLY